jgi:hypothetical protein
LPADRVTSSKVVTDVILFQLVIYYHIKTITTTRLSPPVFDSVNVEQLDDEMSTTRTFFKKPAWAATVDNAPEGEFYRHSQHTYGDIVAANRLQGERASIGSHQADDEETINHSLISDSNNQEENTPNVGESCSTGDVGKDGGPESTIAYSKAVLSPDIVPSDLTKGLGRNYDFDATLSAVAATRHPPPKIISIGISSSSSDEDRSTPCENLGFNASPSAIIHPSLKAIPVESSSNSSHGDRSIPCENFGMFYRDLKVIKHQSKMQAQMMIAKNHVGKLDPFKSKPRPRNTTPYRPVPLHNQTPLSRY